jgi:MraZ protein
VVLFFMRLQGGSVFQGASSISLDVKGRLAVPTKHRDALTGGVNSELVLTAHPHRCLLLYPKAAWAPIRDKVMAFSSLGDAAKLQRLLVGFAEEISMDAAGRLLVSPELRRLAGMEKQVMLVGQGGHFELWSQEAWERQLDKIINEGESLLPAGTENFSL